VRVREIPGPAGALETLLEEPPPTRGVNADGLVERGQADGLRAAVVLAHPHPQYGGTMHSKVIYQSAKAMIRIGCAVLRFNFRGVGASAGEWSGGRYEIDDLAAAVAYARTIAPGLPIALVGYSFGAFQILAYLERGGRADAVALVGVGTKDVSFTPRALPAIPNGTFIVAAENDQFGTADELRAAVPHARIATVSGVDHFFEGKRDEVGALVAQELARELPVTSHLP